MRLRNLGIEITLLDGELFHVECPQDVQFTLALDQEIREHRGDIHRLLDWEDNVGPMADPKVVH